MLKLKRKESLSERSLYVTVKIWSREKSLKMVLSLPCYTHLYGHCGPQTQIKTSSATASPTFSHKEPPGATCSQALRHLALAFQTLTSYLLVLFFGLKPLNGMKGPLPLPSLPRCVATQPAWCWHKVRPSIVQWFLASKAPLILSQSVASVFQSSHQ